MGCARCSAAVFGPLVQNGVSVHKLAERARRAMAYAEDAKAKADIEALCNVAEMLAAEVALAKVSDAP